MAMCHEISVVGVKTMHVTIGHELRSTNKLSDVSKYVSSDTVRIVSTHTVCLSLSLAPPLLNW